MNWVALGRQNRRGRVMEENKKDLIWPGTTTQEIPVKRVLGGST
jgi:hypothetical protein